MFWELLLSVLGFLFGFPVLSVSLAICSIFGAGSCHFNGILQHFGVRSSHVPWYLHHFGARTVHVAWYFATTSRIHLGLRVGLGFASIPAMNHHRAWMKRRFFRGGFSPTPRAVQGSKRSVAPELMAGVVAVPGKWSPTLFDRDFKQRWRCQPTIQWWFQLKNQLFKPTTIGDFLNQGRTSSQFSVPIFEEKNLGAHFSRSQPRFGFAVFARCKKRIHLLKDGSVISMGISGS